MAEVGEVDYAKRAIQRKEANVAVSKSGLPREEHLERQVIILADRLALALAMMCDHTVLVQKASVLDWMQHTEEWATALAGEEPAPAGNRRRRFDFYRKQKPYRYWMQSIRGMLRKQVNNPPEISR